MAPEVAGWLENLQAEIDGAALYRTLARCEDDPALQGVYTRMAEAEERHAAIWRARLEDAGVTSLPSGPSWRTSVLMMVARRFGPQMVIPTIRAREQADAGHYDNQPEAVELGLPADERSHARIFGAIEGTGGMSGGSVAKLEGRHRGGDANALRAAVLGANDGLVSNLSLVMGVAGAAMSGHSILVTGLAGLLAGSLSMALGEWLSVQSARELVSHQMGLEKRELEMDPEEEISELALIYESKGMTAEQSRELATRLVSDQALALDTLSREELGINPEEMGGSAWVAAVTSFILFSIGAIIPVLPYFFTDGMTAAGISIGLSAIGLFALGAGITVITGQGALKSGLRQVGFGAAAAAITFGVGKLIGVEVG